MGRGLIVILPKGKLSVDVARLCRQAVPAQAVRPRRPVLAQPVHSQGRRQVAPVGRLAGGGGTLAPVVRTLQKTTVPEYTGQFKLRRHMAAFSSQLHDLYPQHFVQISRTGGEDSQTLNIQRFRRHIRRFAQQHVAQSLPLADVAARLRRNRVDDPIIRAVNATVVTRTR